MLCWKLCAPQFKSLATTIYNYSLFIRQHYRFPFHTTTIHIPFSYDNTYSPFIRQQYIFPFHTTTINIPLLYDNNTYSLFIQQQQHRFPFHTITPLKYTYLQEKKQPKKMKKKRKKKKKTVNQFERKSSRTRRLGTYSEDEVRRNQAAYPRSLHVNTGAPLFRFVRRAHNAE